MTTTEFYELRFEEFENDLEGWKPQRDSNTKKMIIFVPMPDLDDLKDAIESDLQEFCYDDEELEEDLTRQQEQELFDKLFAEFTDRYNHIVELRKKYEI